MSHLQKEDREVLGSHILQRGPVTKLQDELQRVCKMTHKVAGCVVRQSSWHPAASTDLCAASHLQARRCSPRDKRIDGSSLPRVNTTNFQGKREALLHGCCITAILRWEQGPTVACFCSNPFVVREVFRWEQGVREPCLPFRKRLGAPCACAAASSGLGGARRPWGTEERTRCTADHAQSRLLM